MTADGTDRKAGSGRHGKAASADPLRCPTCLALLPRDALAVPCPGACRHDARGPKAFGRSGLTDAGSRPLQQAWRCPNADSGCMEVLTQVEPAGCGQPLTHPVGMPADRLRHEVLIALDRRPTTLHAGLAALASAVCRPGARPLHPALRPMTPETWRIWRESRTAPGALPLPPMRNGVRPPLVFGLPARAGDWGCRLHLHGWTLDELDRKGMADRPCTAPAVERLARADGLVLLVPAADALDREARKSLIARVQALAAALGECGADGSLRVCLCLLDQEVLFRRLGSGAARPQDVAYHDPRKAAQLVALYVGRSARLEDMGEPLRRFGIAHSVVFAAVGADGSPIGLASWSAAMRAIVGSSA